MTVVCEAERVVHSWPKNRREEVVATLVTYEGHLLADVRAHRVDGDELVPTRKGLMIRVEQLPELLAAVEALIAEAGVAA